MLRKVNWGLCVFSLVLAVIEIAAVLMGQLLLVFPYVVVAGVGVTTVLWFAAQLQRDDSAICAATIALAVFVLCLLTYLVQMFSLLHTML